jgi:hypothetical protein
LFVPFFISFSFRLLKIVLAKLYKPKNPVERLKKFGGTPSLTLNKYINAAKPQIDNTKVMRKVNIADLRIQTQGNRLSAYGK